MRKPLSLLVCAVLVLALTLGAINTYSTTGLASPMRPVAVSDVTTDFSASRDGFPFINHPGADGTTLLGRIFAGLCGGMSYAALDYYWSGQAPAATGADHFILFRDVQSLVANAGSFVLWTLAPDTRSHGPGIAVATDTRAIQLPRLGQALKIGPTPLGLVKARGLGDIGQNHQVVAYALERKGAVVRISIYDPNHPRADDAYLSLDLSKNGGVVEYCDGKAVDGWRGFFVERYSPATPPAPRRV